MAVASRRSPAPPDRLPLLLAPLLPFSGTFSRFSVALLLAAMPSGALVSTGVPGAGSSGGSGGASEASALASVAVSKAFGASTAPPSAVMSLLTLLASSKACMHAPGCQCAPGHGYGKAGGTARIPGKSSRAIGGDLQLMYMATRPSR